MTHLVKPMIQKLNITDLKYPKQYNNPTDSDLTEKTIKNISFEILNSVYQKLKIDYEFNYPVPNFLIKKP